VDEVNPAILEKIDLMLDVPDVFKEFCKELLGEEVRNEGDDVTKVFQRLIERYCNEPEMVSWMGRRTDE